MFMYALYSTNNYLGADFENVSVINYFGRFPTIITANPIIFQNDLLL